MNQYCLPIRCIIFKIKPLLLLQVLGKLILDLVLDHLACDWKHLLEAGRDIAPYLLLLHDLPQHGVLALLVNDSLGLLLDLAGVLDDGGRRYEPQRIDGFGCHHAVLLNLVIAELFVQLLIVQLRCFGQELLGLGVITDSNDLFYFL